MICPMCGERWGDLDVESPYEFNLNMEKVCNVCERKVEEKI